MKKEARLKLKADPPYGIKLPNLRIKVAEYCHYHSLPKPNDIGVFYSQWDLWRGVRFMPNYAWD